MRLDLRSYARAEHFRHFMNETKCEISLADDIDVTALRDACHITGCSFYIAFLYVVSYIVNSRDEFRMNAVRTRGEYAPELLETINPVHNVFHEDTETYTSIFTLWNRDLTKFYQNCADDIERAKNLTVMSVPCPDNSFEASCVPWRHFSSVGLSRNSTALTPVIVWGGFREYNSRTFMPLSITIHHAAADGFHLARFINEAEKLSAAVGANILNTNPKEQ